MQPETDEPDGAQPDGTADVQREAEVPPEVVHFAREKGARVIVESESRWRIERKPALFRLGLYCWSAQLQPNGRVTISEREWRPDPR